MSEQEGMIEPFAPDQVRMDGVTALVASPQKRSSKLGWFRPYVLATPGAFSNLCDTRNYDVRFQFYSIGQDHITTDNTIRTNFNTLPY